jgi:hypothetical protein
MPDTPSTSGFRSLVQQIQEKDTIGGERPRPARRPAAAPRANREAAPAEAPKPAGSRPAAPVRLLQRRWL